MNDLEAIERIFLDYANDKGPAPLHRALLRAFKRGQRGPEPYVWCDEDTTDAEPGDYYVDCGTTMRLDADGAWRAYDDLTDEERAEVSRLCRQ